MSKIEGFVDPIIRVCLKLIYNVFAIRRTNGRDTFLSLNVPIRSMEQDVSEEIESK